MLLLIVTFIVMTLGKIHAPTNIIAKSFFIFNLLFWVTCQFLLYKERLYSRRM